VGGRRGSGRSGWRRTLTECVGEVEHFWSLLGMKNTKFAAFKVDLKAYMLQAT
jgi:hypothetical protein